MFSINRLWSITKIEKPKKSLQACAKQPTYVVNVQATRWTFFFVLERCLCVATSSLFTYIQQLLQASISRAIFLFNSCQYFHLQHAYRRQTNKNFNCLKKIGFRFFFVCKTFLSCLYEKKKKKR